MRKSLVAKQVKYFYDLMDLNVSDANINNSLFKVINNWYQISTALYKLSEYEFVGNSVQDIFDLGASYQSSAEKISIAYADYSKFLTKFNLLKAKCEAVIDSSTFDTDLSNLYIKLPDSLNDLDCLSSIVKDLDIAFNKCPIFSEKIGNISFRKVEEGSNWLVVAIGTIVASAKVLNWVANYIKSCNEIRIQNRTIKKLDLDNIIKEMEIEEKSQKKYKDNFTKNEELRIKELCLEQFKQMGITEEKIKPEDATKIVHCMKTLSDLLDDGVEVYPSISCEEEVKKLFPKQENIMLIEDSQKLLKEPQINKKDE